MEIIIALIVVVIIGTLIYFNRESRGLDFNQDGKVDVEDAKVAVQNATEGLKKEVKAATTKAKTAVKKVAGKKPAVKAKTAGRSGRKS